MLKAKKCPNCGSTSIVGPHLLERLAVAIDLPGFYTATLTALSCTDCGYTELYSDCDGLANLRRLVKPLSDEEADAQVICSRCGEAAKPGMRFCPRCKTLLDSI